MPLTKTPPTSALPSTMPQTARMAVVVINFRTPQLTINCLKTLEPEVEVGVDHVVVVENGSGDDSAEILQTAITEHNWSWVTLVVSDRNTGFSGGNNIGIQAIDAECYLLLNSDTLVRPNALQAMYTALSNNPSAGIVSPRLEWQDGTPQISCFRFHTPWSELIDAAATGPITKILARYDVPIPVSNSPMRPQWTSFACVLLRKDALRDVGLMDEGFFAYFEDVQYCRQLHAAGWDILHWPAARVVHLRGGSSDVKAATRALRRRPHFFYAARARYYALNYGKSGLWLANALWQKGFAISLLREQLGGKQPHICEKQWQDNWINWRNPLILPARGA